MNWLVLVLLLVVIYLVGKLVQERHDRALEVLHWKGRQPLRDAELDERLFVFCPSVGSSYGEEQPEADPLYSYLHRPSGKYLYLKAGGRFFDWQDSVYNGPPLYADLGGIIASGTKCRELVEIDRAQALANLDGK